MEKNIIVSFNISIQNAQKIQSLAKELQISKSGILNDLLNKHLQSPQILPKLKSMAKDNKETYKTIRISLDKNQYSTLQSLAKNSMINSVPKFIKFHILNMIYENKILDSKEIQALALTRAELNKIGANINQIARVLNSQNQSQTDSHLLKTLEHLDKTIMLISNDIKALCHHSQGLIK